MFSPTPLPVTHTPNHLPIHPPIHPHTVEYCLAIKKNEILPFASKWMNLENIMLGEISQRQILYDSTYMRNQKKKKIQKGMCMPNRNRLTDLGEKKLVMPKGKKKC